LRPAGLVLKVLKRLKECAMKIYFPTRWLHVDASAPHPPNTTYLVSQGHEHWGGEEPWAVRKIQMVYDGKVSGRRSPSFPSGTDDFERVQTAMARIVAGEGQTGND